MKLVKYFIIRNGMEGTHSYFTPSSRKTSDSHNRLLFRTTGKYMHNILLEIH